LLSWQNEENDQDPKYFIKYPCAMIVEPPPANTGIGFEDKSCWGDKQEGEENIYTNKVFFHCGVMCHNILSC
jgi:hypothetical protein